MAGCILGPYFDSKQGAVHFAAVHKMFGASKVSKLFLYIPVHLWPRRNMSRIGCTATPRYVQLSGIIITAMVVHKSQGMSSLHVTEQSSLHYKGPVYGVLHFLMFLQPRLERFSGFYFSKLLQTILNILICLIITILVYLGNMYCCWFVLVVLFYMGLSIFQRVYNYYSAYSVYCTSLVGGLFQHTLFYFQWLLLSGLLRC